MHERIRETTVKRLLAWLAVLGLLPLSAAAQNVTYIHTDALGSPVLETNAQAQVVRQVDYRAYGMEVMDAPRPRPGYTGHYRDVGTGLVYMQQRYYDPVVGRFLSADPVATDANTGSTFNRYRYATNNPFTFVDPDGRAEIIFTSGTSQEFKDDFNAVRARSEEYGMPLFGDLDSAPGTLLVSEGNSTKIEGGMYKGKVAAHLSWDSDEGAYVKLSEHTGDTGQQSPAMGLIHEVGHAVEYLNDPAARGPNGKLPEAGVINGPEREWGESAGEPVRTEHGGVPVENKDLFQHE
jgi:RHS repeat-associated protein